MFNNGHNLQLKGSGAGKTYLNSEHHCKKTDLHPRKPSIGFTSDSFSILARASSWSAPVSAHNSLTMSSTFPSGRNSWSGGSSSRIVTGSPEMQKWKFKSVLHIQNTYCGTNYNTYFPVVYCHICLHETCYIYHLL